MIKTLHYNICKAKFGLNISRNSWVQCLVSYHITLGAVQPLFNIYINKENEWPYKDIFLRGKSYHKIMKYI